jgi:hypothetical protein
MSESGCGQEGVALRRYLAEVSTFKQARSSIAELQQDVSQHVVFCILHSHQECNLITGKNNVKQNNTSALYFVSFDFVPY